MFFQKICILGNTVAGHGIVTVLIFCTFCNVAGCNEGNIQTNGKELNIFNQAMDIMLPPDAEKRLDLSNGTVTFLRAKNLSEGLEQDSNFHDLQSTNRLDEVALAFLSAYRLLFKLVHPVDEFIVKSIITDDLGLKHIRFQQVFSHIPIWGAEIIVHLNQSNHVYLVNGRYIPTPSTLSTIPVLSSEEALHIVARNLPGVGLKCDNCKSALVIFGTKNNKPHLVYRVLATVSIKEGWEIFIDAKTGVIIEKLSTIYTGINYR
jgi:Zn-dependent metalloprotease